MTAPTTDLEGNFPHLRFDRGTLVLTGLDAAALAQVFPTDNPFTFDARIGDFRAAGWQYAAVIKVLRTKFGPRFSDEVPAPETVEWPMLDMPPLRTDQRAAVDSWYQQDCCGQVIMPTGTGKTEVALAAMVEAATATLIVAPVRDLMYQWQHRILRRTGYNAGIVGDNLFNLQPVTVTTYDSAYIHMATIGAQFGLIIFDEEHHLPGRYYREAAMFSTAPLRLGLTATPERSDGLESDLEWLIGPVVYEQRLSEAAGDTLADYNVVRVPVALSDAEQTRYNEFSYQIRRYMYERNKENKGYTLQKLCADAGHDPEARKIQKMYYAKQAIEDRAEEKLRVLEDLFQLHAGERIIVFAGSNLMAMDISRRFLVPTLLSHSRKQERIAVLEGFATGEFPVIVANQVLDEGVDVPAAKIAIVVGGQASTRQAKQRLGRILRKSGAMRATLYEVICEDTNEVKRSRERRRSDAFERTVHRRV